MRIASFVMLSVTLAAHSTAAQLPHCQLVTIPVTISGVQQKNFTAPIDYSTYDGSYASLPNLTVSGTFNISASLCSPTTVNATRSSALQVLVHGGSYNKTYWSGLQVPPQSINGTTYSWVRYAASQGYSTLSIDRLCNGNSSRPDAANICQVQTQAAVIHQLIQRARSGTLIAQSSRAFSTIIYVGHSLGSELGSYYLNNYAGYVNATILTGFSSFSFGNTLSYSNGIRPARHTFARFSRLEPAYVVSSDPNTTETSFYHGSYNSSVSSLDYQGTGTVAVGEFASFPLGFEIQSNIRIPVFVMNGQQDLIFCPLTPLDSLFGNGGWCGVGATSLTARTKVLFPNAVSFSHYDVPKTGHCINLHYTAPMAFTAAQKFLNAQGF